MPSFFLSLMKLAEGHSDSAEDEAQLVWSDVAVLTVVRDDFM